MELKNNQFLHGSGGTCWVDGEELAAVKSVEAKVTGQFEDVNVAGAYETHHQYVGYSIEGTVTLVKTRSFALAKVAPGFISGEIPEVKIITKLENKLTGAAERAALTGVSFTEFDIANFEAKTMAEEPIPFKATYYEVLETIA